MTSLARMLCQPVVAWTIVVLTVVLGLGSVVAAQFVQRDDDLLAFLPEGNEDIETFYAINKKFGGLDVALVGIETEDVFDPAFVEALGAASQAIDDTEGVEYVLSLTTADDFIEDPVMGGVKTSVLVEGPPASAEEQAALRAKVLSRDHYVGHVVSEDGDAVLVYVFAAYGAEPRQLAADVRAAMLDAFGKEGVPAHTIHWGGAPFINTYIYDTTQQDMRWLTPWAVVAIIVIILASFRDIVGSGLALVSTAIGIFVAQGAMAVAGVEFNIVLSAMPVILFAVGSAYAIHMLARYYANLVDLDNDRDAALVRTVVETGPTVLAAGLTTVAGLLSFVVMDIRPMRTFGVFTALGIFTTLVLALTFVPAVIRILRPRPWFATTGAFNRWMVTITTSIQARPIIVGGALVVLSLIGLALIGRVDNRMDQSAFFERGSPPDQAQTFLDEHFGGSQFLQLHIKGDMSDPHVLRETRRIADHALRIPEVTQVIEATEAVGTVNQVMAGVNRVPDKPEQVALLYRFLQGNASVGQLVTDERDEGLMHIKIGSNKADDLDEALARVEAIVAEEAMGPYRIVPTDGPDAEAARAGLRDIVVARVLAVAEKYDVEVKPAAEARLPELLDRDGASLPREAFRASFLQFLQSEECWVELDEAQAETVAQVTSEVDPATDEATWRELLHDAMGGDETDDEARIELETLVDDILLVAGAERARLWREHRAEAQAVAIVDALELSKPGGARGDRFIRAVGAALTDLTAPTAAIPTDEAGAPEVVFEISGLPLLYRGMSSSVTVNQFKSLGFALVLVFVIMTVLFRSPITGLLATAPTALTLLVVYGGMGAMGVHLDIGTSMLASIIIGAGVDYSVHLLAAWRGADRVGGLARAVRETAPAIWTNALMVAAGFFVLTLGEAKPLQNVGGLTSAAMIGAAIMTFTAIPVLARRASYGRRG